MQSKGPSRQQTESRGRARHSAPNICGDTGLKPQTWPALPRPPEYTIARSDGGGASQSSRMGWFHRLLRTEPLFLPPIWRQINGRRSIVLPGIVLYRS